MINKIISFIKIIFKKENSDFISLSPFCQIRQLIIHTIITINYKRPAARNRKMIGSLVPYGQLWKTGAGRCSTIHFSKPVIIGNKEIPDGTYSIFTIPGEKEWTIILNTAYKLEGADQYDQAKDIIRLKTSPERTDRYYESLTIGIDVLSNTADLSIAWENVYVHFPITVNLTANPDYNSRLEHIMAGSV